jgi:signal transduction histidine kinase
MFMICLLETLGKYSVRSIIIHMLPHHLSDYLAETSSGVLQLGGARMALLDIEAGLWALRRQIEALIGTHLTDEVFQQAGANGGASFARSFSIDLDQSGKTAFTTCLQVYQAAGFGQFEITTMEWPIGCIIIRAHQTFEAWMKLQNKHPSPEPCCAYTAGVLVGFVNVISERKDVVCIERYCQVKGDEYCQFELLPADKADHQAVVAFSPDPGLGRQINLLEMLFERMPMGIAILDREYRIQRYNPTWEDFADRYAPPSGAPLVPGVSYFDHLPGTETTIVPLFKRALDGKTVRQSSVRLETEGIVTYWDIVLAPLVENNKIVGILNVAVDATERVEARQNLEQRVEERTRELQVLLEVTSVANSSLNLDEILEKTLDRVVTLVGATRVGVIMLDESTGDLTPYMLRPESSIDPDDLEKMVLACEPVIESGEPLYITPDSTLDLHKPGALLPLKIRGRSLGVLGIIGSQESSFDISQLVLFKSIADQLGVAIENARLFEKAEEVAISAERNRLARDLHDSVTQTLFSSSLITEVLPQIWQNNPEEAQHQLEELRQLTKGALSEMRTLLLELRPAALADIKLSDLIGHQVNAFNARTRVRVEYNYNCVQDPPSNVKETFYRIAQEAFNNIAKHAEATFVNVQLDCHPDRAVLVIQDNGIGFNLEAVRAAGLGLGIMRERAQNVGARLEIQSHIRAGTRLRFFWGELPLEQTDE